MTTDHTRTQDTASLRLLLHQISLLPQILHPDVNVKGNQIVIAGVIVTAAAAKVSTHGLATENPWTSWSCIVWRFFIVLFLGVPYLDHSTGQVPIHGTRPLFTFRLLNRLDLSCRDALYQELKTKIGFLIRLESCLVFYHRTDFGLFLRKSRWEIIWPCTSRLFALMFLRTGHGSLNDDIHGFHCHCISHCI
jgi:hypothetical protein